MLPIFRLVGICFFLFGCGPNLPSQDSFNADAKEITEVNTRVGQRVLMLREGCPLTRREASFAVAPALLAALVPAVADFAVRAVRDEVQRAQDERNATYLARGSGSLSETNCIVVVRGVFGTAPSGTPSRRGLLRIEDLTTLGLAGYPGLYMEASVQPLATTSAVGGAAAATFRVRPEVVQFANTAALRRGDGRKNVAMLIVLRGATLDTRPSPNTEALRKDAAVAMAFDFGPMLEGTVVRGDGPSVHRFADQVQALQIASPNIPLNAYALVSETADPSRVLALLSETLKDQNDNLEKALSDYLTFVLRRNSGGANP